MVSSREGDSSLTSLGRCGTGALPTPITTMPWMENAPAIQVMMMVPPWTAAPQPDTRLPFEQWCARQEGQRAQARSWQPSAKQKAAQWWNKLVGKQTTTKAPSHESPWHEPLLEAERTLIVDFASTHARAKGVASSTSHEGGQPEATAAKPLNASPPPTTDGVDKLYHQIAEIHAIATT
jgi:hypothetical protein